MPRAGTPALPRTDPQILGAYVLNDNYNSFISKAGSLPGLVMGRGPLAGAVEPCGTGNRDGAAGLGGWTPHTGSICSSSPSTASIWWKAAWEPMTTRVAPARKYTVQGLAPSPGPHHPLPLPRPCTHPGPRRQQNLHQPARRRERRRTQQGHTDGQGSPLGLGADSIGAVVPTHVPSPRVIPDAPQQSDVTSSWEP